MHRSLSLAVALALPFALVTPAHAAAPPAVVHPAVVPQRTAPAAAVAPAVKITQKAASVTLRTTAALNLRSGYTASSKRKLTIPKGTTIEGVKRVSNGWWKVMYKEKTIGYVSGSYVKAVSPQPTGRFVYLDGKYTSNRESLTDRYFTKADKGTLYRTVGGTKMVGDLPANSIVYRDLKNEKLGGQRSGWYFVRTQGLSGWMKVSTLKRTTSAPTVNTKKVTRAQVAKQANGKVPSSMLVAIPWDKEKTLIAAPALADLTRLNTAFKKKFGRNLDVDLAFRTLDTQKQLYKELGAYIAAKPGTSNHGWGLAIDVPETSAYDFGGKYYAWLKANSAKYNWVHRKDLEQYNSNGKKNPGAEAWHFEYRGK